MRGGEDQARSRSISRREGGRMLPETVMVGEYGQVGSIGRIPEQDYPSESDPTQSLRDQ